MDLMIIYPEKGHEKAIAQLLLSLATHPYDVAVVSAPFGYRVPKYLWDDFDVAYPLLGKTASEVAAELWEMPMEQLEALAASAPEPDEAGKELLAQATAMREAQLAEAADEATAETPKRRGRPVKKEEAE